MDEELSMTGRTIEAIKREAVINFIRHELAELIAETLLTDEVMAAEMTATAERLKMAFKLPSVNEEWRNVPGAREIANGPANAIAKGVAQLYDNR